MVIELLPEADRVTAINTINDNGDSLLHRAVKVNATLELLLSYYPLQARFEALNKPNKQGLTVWSLVFDNIDKLKLLLNHLPKEDLSKALISLKFINSNTINALIQELMGNTLPNLPGGKLISVMLESVAPSAKSETLIAWLSDSQLLLTNTVSYFKLVSDVSALTELFQDFCAEQSLFNTHLQTFAKCKQSLVNIMANKQQMGTVSSSLSFFGPVASKRERHVLNDSELEQERIGNKLAFIQNSNHNEQQADKIKQLDAQQTSLKSEDDDSQRNLAL